MTGKIITAIKPTTLSTLATEGGIFLIDKPFGWTSFDVVNRLRYKLKRILNDKKIKVGHAGTLDPLATGLLIVCVGKMTKQIDAFMGLPKAYTGTFRMGETTPSYDSETKVNAIFPTEHITPSVIEAARQGFLGEIDQLPPIFSAIKKDGKPLYESARQGKDVKVSARRVHVDTFEIHPMDAQNYSFEVACSKGTYIRSLIHDFGKACASGAYLTALQRTAIGGYLLVDAWDLGVLTEALEEKN